MGRLGSARSAPGVKLHSSLGSEENLLKPGVAQGGDGGAGDGTGSSFLRPSGFLSDAGPVGAHRLGKGLVALWPPKEDGAGGGPTDIREDKVWFFSRFLERLVPVQLLGPRRRALDRTSFLQSPFSPSPTRPSL